MVAIGLQYGLISRLAGTNRQYWLYYADSATLRGIPVAGAKGFHPDDWECQ